MNSQSPAADKSSELRIALQAAEIGGEILANYFRTGIVARAKDTEATYNLVSDADVESERAITQYILSAFPEHAILGEEEGRGSTDAEHLWIVDPLDGTNNFLHRIPHFAVSIAYYFRGQAKCGVVLNPVRNDLYWAEFGKGAFHHERRLAVSGAKQLSETMVGVGFYYDRGAMMEATLAAVADLFRQNIHGIRRFGTAALDLCQVADGQFGAFFEYQLSPWDFAAGRLIVEEAGGRVTACDGSELPNAQSTLLATNGELHAATLAIVNAHMPR